MKRQMDLRRQNSNRIYNGIIWITIAVSVLTVGRIMLVCHKAGMLYTFGIFYLAAAVGIYSIMKGALFLQETLFSLWIRLFLALLFTGSQVLGLYYSIPGMEEQVYTGEIVLWIFFLSPLTFGVQNMLFAWVMAGSRGNLSRGGQAACGDGDFAAGRSFCIAWIVILTGFMIPFAAYYPAIMAYDVIPQLDQIRISGYTTHHPLIHTLMLAFCLKAGEIMPLVKNADRAGLAVYTILQMLIVAGCFAYVSVFMRRKGVHKYVCRFFVLCAAFYPTHGMLAVSITKDTIYAVLVMVFTTFVWELMSVRERLLSGGKVSDGREGGGRRAWGLAYLVLTVLLLLFRNNSVYAWVLYLVVVSIVLYGRFSRASEGYREFCKKISLVHVAALVLYLILNAGMTAAVHADSATYAREMLSVPAQQIARVTAYHEEELTEKDRERLAVVWGEDTLPEYVPAIADRSKRDITGDSDVLGALMSEWISLGMRYPGEYLKAFLLKNKGMWYLEDSSYLDDIYSYAKGYLQMSYPNDQQEYIQTLVPGYVRHQRLQLLQAVYRYFAGGDSVWKYIPPLALIMQPAFYCWLLFYYCVCCIGLKRRKALVPAVYIVALAGTLLLGPCVLTRYMYPVMLSVTVMLLLAVSELRSRFT